MHTFLTPDPITVEVRNAAGSVHIDLADVTTATVDITSSTGHPFGFIDDLLRNVGGRRRGAWRDGAEDIDTGLDDPTERVRVQHREEPGGGALIVDTDPARAGWRASFVVRITAPAASGVRVQTQSADVQVTGPADRLEVRTASGDVSVGEVARGALVQTAAGDLRIASVGGDLDARTVSGDLVVESIGGAGSVQSTSGNVRIDHPAGNLAVRTVSGDVRVADGVTGSLETTTVSGDVEIGVHAGTLAAVSLSTISGDTVSDFEVSDDTPVEAGVGGPVLDIRVKTTSGDIRLRRAALV